MVNCGLGCWLATWLNFPQPYLFIPSTSSNERRLIHATSWMPAQWRDAVPSSWIQWNVLRSGWTTEHFCAPWDREFQCWYPWGLLVLGMPTTAFLINHCRTLRQLKLKGRRHCSTDPRFQEIRKQVEKAFYSRSRKELVCRKGRRLTLRLKSTQKDGRS